MSIELAVPAPVYFDEMARIVHDAFRAFQLRHGFEPDFPDISIARRLVEGFSDRKNFLGVVALENGQVVGSNFVSVFDSIGGIGPITVDPNCQSRGVGRRLMQAVVDDGRKHGLKQFRLMQDSHNTTSLSLYTSLGFDWRHAVAVMEVPQMQSESGSGARSMTEADISQVSELVLAKHKADRRNEIAWLRGMGSVVRERDRRITGYLTPGQLGFGAAETIEDVIAILRHIGAAAPPPSRRFFCPLGLHELHRACQQLGCRLLRVMNLMTMGQYEQPVGIWMPSILF